MFVFLFQRPWFELENNFAIMFKVGMGAIPVVPDHLSEEGKDFLSHCLIHDSKLRWSASQLLDHTFVKVSFYRVKVTRNNMYNSETYVLRPL